MVRSKYHRHASCPRSRAVWPLLGFYPGRVSDACQRSVEHPSPGGSTRPDAANTSARLSISSPRSTAHVPPALLADRLAGVVSAGALATYCALQSLDDDTTETRGELAKLLGIGKRTLQRHLSELDEAGWVDRDLSSGGHDVTLGIRGTRRAVA